MSHSHGALKALLESPQSPPGGTGVPDDARHTLTPYGFADIKGAWANILALTGDPHVKGLFAGILEHLFDLLAQSPDPDMALRNFTRFSEASLDRTFLYSLLRDNPSLLTLLIQVFGYSEYLSDILVRNPEYLDWIIDTGLPARTRDELFEDLGQTLRGRKSREAKLNTLRRFKRREILRIGIRDILGLADVEGITAEISWLAETSLQVAYDVCRADLVDRHGTPMTREGQESGFSVIGMGKLGGEELNFSSDIDLLFVYDEEGMTSGPAKTPSHTFFARLGEEILKAIGGMTDEGYCYRVDMRLRPEGRSGPLVRALSDYESYYEAWGETWERLALTKARHVAGDPAVGRKFLGIIEPFVYRRHLEYSTLSEIRHLKQRTEEEISTLTQRHLKLGIGGIREVEFVVQTLQILSGAAHPDIKEVNTLRALRKLSSARLLGDDEVRALSDAYVFLRKAEHRLQMYLDRQLHTLPQDQTEMRRLGMRMGFAGEEAFEAALKGHTHHVREIFEKILSPPAPHRPHDHDEEAGLSLGSHPDQPPAEALLDDDSLRKNGFGDPEAARRTFLSMKAPLRSDGRWKFDMLLPALLKAVTGTPDPDLTLARFERFLSSTGARGAYLMIFHDTPGALDLLMTIMGGSEFLSRLLIANPSLFDSLVATDSLKERKSAGLMEKELRGLIVPSPLWRERLDIIRRFKKAELLRIGTRDLMGLSDGETVSSELSDLAEACLEASLSCAAEEIAGDHGAPAPGTSFVLLGMGKLGGQEMNYGSDLDLIAVYSQEGTTSGGRKPLAHYLYFPELMGKILESLGRQTSEGTAFSLDLRLRPMGEKGPLAQSLDSLAEYLSTASRAWEKLAYTRARPVAGDKSLGAHVVARIHDIIYSRPPEARQVREIRDRMIQERLGRGDRDPRITDVKLGRGGIVDIEFIVQFLTLCHGGSDPALRKPGTKSALCALVQKEIVSAEDGRRLRSAYELFRKIEMRLRIVQDRSLDAFPSEPSALGDLAMRLGSRTPHGGEQLAKDVADHIGNVRDIYKKFIGEAP